MYMAWCEFPWPERAQELSSYFYASAKFDFLLLSRNETLNVSHYLETVYYPYFLLEEVKKMPPKNADLRKDLDRKNL